MKPAQALAWVDGGARGNPGEAGFGAILEAPDGTVFELSGYLGRTTNNVAEYAALIAALELAGARGIRDLTLHSDSLLLVQQMRGLYRVKAVHLRPLHARASERARRIPSLRLVHVRRHENQRADALVNRAIDERRVAPEWFSFVVPKGP
jgi:ribonuclease HI